MFESLSERFEGIFTRLRSKGTLRESDVDEVLREIRLALLEADVNFVVVKTMLERIRERAVGARIHEALNPVQQVVKLVNEALVEALGGEAIRIQYASRPPTVVLMAGLQGSGKTTNAAKLARWFRQQGRNPLLVGADLQRPAAVEEARRLGRDVCIVDTAGRLAIDAEMMDQVRRISRATQPDYTFLVVDAMTGQDAVTVAESFDATFTLDGVLEQLQQVRKMGPLQNLMGMMPGVPKELRNTEVDEDQVSRVEAIIRSMTREERVDPNIIDGSRRLRIANGSGTQTADVSQLIRQFREMQKLMKRMPGLSGTKGVRGRKGRKGRKGGGRVTPPGGGRVTPRQPFTLPGLNQ